MRKCIHTGILGVSDNYQQRSEAHVWPEALATCEVFQILAWLSGKTLNPFGAVRQEDAPSKP